jgi:DNA-binding NtrC family response regulator
MEPSNIITEKQTSLIEVLVVEDETLIGWSLASKLKQAGFAVTVVDTGEKAIEKFFSSHFDIVLTDYKLPKIDGFIVASKIKASFPQIPVIMMSAYRDCPAYKNEMRLSIDCFIEKPFDLSEVAAIVRMFTSAKTV